MSQETELKLCVAPSQATLLRQTLTTAALPQGSTIEPAGTVQLANTYFDTPDLRLHQARVALRIRQCNGQFIQTLKTQGESVNGLSRRGEWEWILTSDQLDGTLLTPLWPSQLGDVSVANLQPLFSTDFHRTRWLLLWHEPYARVEVALDQGEIRAGTNTSPICELELELLEGSEVALMAMADWLHQQVPLTPGDDSKAERGFALLTR